MACDEECTKQKAQDRLLAVINELPDLMKPSSDDIDDSIQEIQSRTYSDDPDGTPTMNENSSVNELLAATMEPPPPPPEDQFAKVDPVTGETLCIKIPLEYHKMDDDEYHFGNRNLTDDLKAKGRSSAYNGNQIDGLCVIKATWPIGTNNWGKSRTGYLIKGPRACEIMGDCMYQNPECEPDGVSPSKGGCGHNQTDSWNTTNIYVNDDTGEIGHWGSTQWLPEHMCADRDPNANQNRSRNCVSKLYEDRGANLQATIENFIQNTGVEMIAKRYNQDTPGVYDTIE
jgi:hypothetical protein